jgi:hypothetical protein
MPNKSDEPKNVETEERKYLKPVAWLGGRDLLANLKYFLLFAAFKGKLDPRDWMTAAVFPPPDKVLETDIWGKAYVDAFNKSYRDVETIEEFWFDYFADSGDGMTAGYALAYLCMSDLQVTLPNGSAPSREHTAAGEIRSRLARGDKLKQIADDYRDTAPREITRLLYEGANRDAIIKFIENSIPGIVSFAQPRAEAGQRSTTLPRGAFLFVGGDTSYHVADFAGLGLRFQKTFQWAATDLGIDIESEAEERRRPIFGVPGNHDYYDMVDGFNRQFRQPLTKEKNYINLPRRGMPPQLQLPTFKRVQMASYVAIKLPFDWWFWGVDSELPRVDLRQQDFFKRSYSENNPAGAKQQQIEHLGHEPTEEERELLRKRLERYPHGDIWPFPKKLIIATSEPAVVEGRREPEDGKTPQAFRFLDLRRPFLYPKGPLDENNDVWRQEEELEVVDFDCRLDISGDVHHYARYWGSEEFGGHYASVVSGGGGASMSPTQTDYEEVKAQAIYPSKEASTRVINKELFKPWVVIRGGNIWLVGLIIGIIVYFGASFPESHYDFTESLVDTLLTTPDFTRPLGWPGDVWQILCQWFFQFRAAGAFSVVKLSFLLLVATSAIAVAGAGYARWLFERLTRTHDWVYDKLHNLKFKLKEKHNKPRPENAPTKEEYKRFLNHIERQVRLPVPRTQWWAFLGSVCWECPGDRCVLARRDKHDRHCALLGLRWINGRCGAAPGGDLEVFKRFGGQI